MGEITFALGAKMSERRLKILISALGSHGDIHPFLGIAKTLSLRGHQIVFIAPANYAKLVGSLGFEFVGIGDPDHLDRLGQDPDLWHPTRAIRLVCKATLELMPLYYLTILDHYEPGKTVSVVSTLAIGGRVAEDKLGIPTVSVHLSPTCLRSIEDPGNLRPLPLRAWHPEFLKRLVWEMIDEFVLEPLLAPGLNEFRAGVGLGPVEKIFGEWVHSPRRVIGLFPEWFAAMPRDWPRQTVLTGFPLYDEADVSGIDEGLKAFLDAGEKPIAFTPGSAMRHAREYFEAAVEACGRLGKRGLLVSRFSENYPVKLPETVRAVEYAPFSQLLPRCAAIVHHGGIGTSAQGLAAGVPQLVMPMSHDQPDNGARLEKLGVARSVPAERFNARRAAEALKYLLESVEVRKAAEGIRMRMKGEDSLVESAKWIEKAGNVRK